MCESAQCFGVPLIFTPIAKLVSRTLVHLTPYLRESVGKAGTTDREMAETLRHSLTALVKRYAHLSPTHLTGVMERLSKFGQPVEGFVVSDKTGSKSGTLEGEKEGNRV
jgi:hypothetical protein